MNNNSLFAYHVVTERPIKLGQKIVFDSKTHSGVYNRVMEKKSLVDKFYSSIQDVNNLEHHLAVAIRELALEEVREKEFPNLPSRMSCLYVSNTLEEARQWFNYFKSLGRNVYGIFKVKINGRMFVGDANNCFYPSADKKTNIKLARNYWLNKPNLKNEPPIYECLVDGTIEFIERVD